LQKKAEKTRHRRALWVSIFEGLKIREVDQIPGIPESTTSARAASLWRLAPRIVSFAYQGLLGGIPGHFRAELKKEAVERAVQG
jgi:hypothetical protein